jgi:hypothetical protein
MIRIDNPLLSEISARAKASPRRRMNYNFHQTSEDLLNRMLNAMEPGTYVCPHKHENPDKREAFLILKGSILVVEFDNDEIPPRTFHTLICLEPGSVLYELKDGPYDQRNDKQFAGWAPMEGDSEAPVFMQRILEELDIQQPD